MNRCGAGTEAELLQEGQRIGTVTVTNDATAIYITFRTEDEWFISNSLLSISPTPYGI